MKLLVQQSDLSQAIRTVKNACSKINVTPILQNIKLETVSSSLVLTANNLSEIICTEIGTVILEEGSICVYAQKFDEIISKLDGEITLEVKEGSLIIKAGKSKFKMACTKADQFPVKTNIGNKYSANLKLKDLQRGLKATTFIRHNTADKSITSGVCFNFENNTLSLACTDGNRLSYYEMDYEGDNFKIVIPTFILNEIIKNEEEDINIRSDGNMVLFSTVNTKYFSNLINGQYPDIKRLLPKNELDIKIKREDLIKSLEKVATLVDVTKNIVKMTFGKEILGLEVQSDNGTAKDDVPTDYNEDEFKTAFNYKYLLEGLKNCDKDEIVIHINKTLSPVVLDLGYTYLVMPIKIRE